MGAVADQFYLDESVSCRRAQRRSTAAVCLAQPAQRASSTPSGMVACGWCCAYCKVIKTVDQPAG